MRRKFLSLCSIVLMTANAEFNFVSLGNFGGPNQRTVESTLRKDASKLPYSLFISPGSSFSRPVTDIDDEIWNSEFFNVYSGPEFNTQFLEVAGDRDWEGNIIHFIDQTTKTYSAANAKTKGLKWTFPNWYYHHAETFTDTSESNTFLSSPEVSVLFVMIDTHMLQPNFISKSHQKAQMDYLTSVIENGHRVFDWVIVVGDKPIYSSGSSGGDSFLEANVRPLLKKYKVDAYISGKDANMEVIEDGTLHLINCGSSSYTKSGKIRSFDGSVVYKNKVGYCRHKLTKNTMITELIDGITGEVLYTDIKDRNVKIDGRVDKLKILSKMPKISYNKLPQSVGGTPSDETFRTYSNLFLYTYGLAGLLIYTGVIGAALMTINFRIGRWISNKNAITPIKESTKKVKLITEKKTHIKKSHK